MAMTFECRQDGIAAAALGSRKGVVGEGVEGREMMGKGRIKGSFLFSLFSSLTCLFRLPP